MSCKVMSAIDLRMGTTPDPDAFYSVLALNSPLSKHSLARPARDDAAEGGAIEFAA